MRGLEGGFHQEECAESLARVRARQMDGREFLLQECDGKFTDEDLNEEGNSFMQSCYDGRYFSDHASSFNKEQSPSLYHVENTWENFDRIASVLDQRLADWKEEQQK